MFTLLGLIVDAIIVVVFVATIFAYIKRGFVSSLLGIMGTVASLLIGIITSNILSPIIFDKFFRPAIVENTQNAIQSYGSASVEDILSDVLGVFPDAFVSNVTGSVSGIINSQAAGAVEGYVDSVAAPMFVPVISVVVFLIVFIVCKLICVLLEKTLGKTVNRIPIVGGLNQGLGAVLGIFGGVVNAVLVIFLFWFALAITGGNLPSFSNADLHGSFFYRLFLEFNPFF